MKRTLLWIAFTVLMLSVSWPLLGIVVALVLCFLLAPGHVFCDILQWYPVSRDWAEVIVSLTFYGILALAFLCAAALSTPHKDGERAA